MPGVFAGSVIRYGVMKMIRFDLSLLRPLFLNKYPTPGMSLSTGMPPEVFLSAVFSNPPTASV